MTTYIAASLAVPDTNQCLAVLHELAPAIDLSEICLDAMTSFDLPELIRRSPCPLIITCRPRREGGSFSGSETERIEILMQAMDLGCAYIDVEWDTIRFFAQRRSSATRLIASRHWFDHMPANLMSFYEELRVYADVVKLAGMAYHPGDVLPIFTFLRSASSPVIGIAMGAAGQITRLLAPCFPHCLLTYAASTYSALTAPGQLTVSDLVQLYHLPLINDGTALHIHLCANTVSAQAVSRQNTSSLAGKVLNVPVVTSLEEVEALGIALQEFLPNITLTVDPLLAKGTPGEARFERKKV